MEKISALVQKFSASSDATIARHGSVTLKVLKSVAVVESSKHGGEVAGEGGGDGESLIKDEARVLTDVGNRVHSGSSTVVEQKGGAGEASATFFRGDVCHFSDRMRELQREVKQTLQANMQSLQNRVTAANLKAI